MPSHSQFADSDQFLSALSAWAAEDEAAYRHLRGIFDATPEYSVRPNWVEEVAIKHISMAAKPADEFLEAALRNLSGYVLHHEQKIVRIAYGPLDDHWAIFAQVENA